MTGVMEASAIDSALAPAFPPGGSYEPPRAKRGIDFAPAAATGYDRLPRTLKWAWWRPLVALAVGGAAALVGMFAVAAVCVVWVVQSGQVAGNADALLGWVESSASLDATDLPMLVLGLGSIAVWIPAIYLGLRAAGMRPLGHISSVAYRLRWGWLGRCVLLAIATLAVNFGLAFAVEAVAGVDPSDAPVELTPLTTFLPALAVILLLVPFQAAAEEYVFRGLLVQSLASWLPRRPWARVIVVVVPTAAFVASHGYGLWGLLDVGVFALTALWVTLRTGGLEAAIALHVVNNIVAFGFLASGLAGTTQNEADQGSLVGLLISIFTSICFAWAVAALAKRRGIRRTSSWPQAGKVPPLRIPLPAPTLLSVDALHPSMGSSPQVR